MATKLQQVLEGGDGVTMLTEALRQALKGEGRSHDALKRLIQEVCVQLVDHAADWPLLTPPLPSLHPPNPCPEPKPRVLPTNLDCMGADSYTVDTDRTALCLASEILTDPLSDRPVTLSLPRVDDEEPDVLMLSDAGHERVMNTITG